METDAENAIPAPNSHVAVVQESKFGLALIRTRLRSHEHILEEINEETLLELGKMAKKGCTLPEMADELGISFPELVKTRMVSEDFDKMCEVLETTAASKHLASARHGIKNPKDFNSAAYDRVMGALGFTPHVEHVVSTTKASDPATTTHSTSRVGFDVEGFMGKHGETTIIDVTPEPDEETLHESGESDEESIL